MARNFGLGLSGDSIVITDGCVVKACRTNQERFLRNAQKQAQFSNPHIAAVPILDQGFDGYENWIKMPFLNTDNALIWLSKVDTSFVFAFIDKLTDYLSYVIAHSTVAPFDYCAWRNKVLDLLATLASPKITPILLRLYTLRFNGMYYGDYHGDLTLTNLLVSSNGYGLSLDAIDFLDSFIHSPINDVVKIRQDTKHFWTFNLWADRQFDANKTCIALQYIDEALGRFITNDPILSECYLPFQILNLIRILPYNHDPHIAAYLMKEIEALYDEFDRSSKR